MTKIVKFTEDDADLIQKIKDYQIAHGWHHLSGLSENYVKTHWKSKKSAINKSH